MFVKPGTTIDRNHGSKDQVKKAQKELKKLGYYKGEVDGIYGDDTEKAVKKFQKDNGLIEDGVVGPGTGAMLNDKYAEALEKEREAIEQALQAIQRAFNDLKKALDDLKKSLGK